MKRVNQKAGDSVELGTVDARALQRFVAEVLNGRRRKPKNPQLRTFTVRVELALDEQIKLGVLCERANMQAGPFLAMHTRCALWKLFDKITPDDVDQYLERMRKDVAAMT